MFVCAVAACNEAPPVAHAQEEPPPASVAPSLEWSAPEGCPAQDALRAAVLRNFNDAIPATTLRARAVVSRSAGRRPYRLSLSLERDGRVSTRELSGVTCEALLDSAALVVSLAIDPDFSAAELAPPIGEPRVVPAEPAVLAESNSEEHAATNSPIEPPTSVADADRRSEAVEVASTSRWFVGVSAFGDYGTTSAIAPGAGLHMRAQWNRFGLLLGIAGHLRGHVAVSNNVGADVNVLSVPLAACQALHNTGLNVRACAGIESSLIFAAGSGNSIPARAIAPTLALFAELSASLQVVAHAFVGLSFAVDVPMVRPRFTIDAVEVFRPGMVGMRTQLFFELEI